MEYVLFFNQRPLRALHKLHKIIYCNQTVKTLIRCQRMWHLVWIYTVCLCPINRMLVLNESMYYFNNRPLSQVPPLNDVYLCGPICSSRTLALYLFHGWKFKISKILNFRNSNFWTCMMPTKMNNFMFKWLIVLYNLKIIQRSYYNLPNSAFRKPASKSWIHD